MVVFGLIANLPFDCEPFLEYVQLNRAKRGVIVFFAPPLGKILNIIEEKWRPVVGPYDFRSSYYID